MRSRAVQFAAGVGGGPAAEGEAAAGIAGTRGRPDTNDEFPNRC